MTTGTPRPDAPNSPTLVPGLQWRRVFPGEERQLAALRRWLSSLLPDCPARNDVLSVATELGGNAIQHTDSGQDGGWFAVEVTWQESVVQVAVADCGGAAEPRVIDDPAGERGRGLLLIQGLSLRTGCTGDQRGRLAWAHIAWDDPALAGHPPSQDPYQAAVRDGEAALARRFAGVPAWFGRSTLAWWAVAGSQGLVSAPTPAMTPRAPPGASRPDMPRHARKRCAAVTGLTGTQLARPGAARRQGRRGTGFGSATEPPFAGAAGELA